MADFYEIHDWHDHQLAKAKRGRPMSWVPNWTSLLRKQKYQLLSPSERGILHGLWMLRGVLGDVIPSCPDYVRSSLVLGRYKYLSRTLEKLERRGFIVKVSRSDKRERIRGDSAEDSSLGGAKKIGPRPPSNRPLTPEEIRTRLEVLKGGG
jgi:hypothetical protein